MAFTAASLYRVAIVGDTTKWLYKTADAIATVIASGYFNNHTNELRQYDTIEVVSTTGPTVDLITVSSATGAATVTTVNGT